MYVSIASRTGGRKYLSIVHGYRDENGKVRKKTIRSLGYLDELEKEYEDPIAHFKAVAKEMDTQRKQETYGYDLCINQQEKLSVGTDNMKNFGYAALSKIYHELELDSFLKNRQRHTEDTFDANAVLQALTYLKIVAPAADSTFFIDRELFFEKNISQKQACARIPWCTTASTITVLPATLSGSACSPTVRLCL